MSIGASQIRLRISNAFGLTNLPITSLTIALPFNNTPGCPLIIPSTLKTVTFSGNTSIIIPNGSQAVSDPLDFEIQPQSMISVTMFLAEGQTTNDITSHPGSRTTSWMSFGDHVSATNLTDPSVQSVAHWYVHIATFLFLID